MSSIPRLRQPVRASIFADRAARLRQLAQDHPLSTYLLLMAGLADGQGKALKHCNMPGPSNERIDLAQAHGMPPLQARSEEHTSELQSLMRISYAVFCLKKK